MVSMVSPPAVTAGRLRLDGIGVENSSSILLNKGVSYLRFMPLSFCRGVAEKA
jgi:hypothetical protein